MFEIKKGIPLPGGEYQGKYISTLRIMEVNDCFDMLVTKKNFKSIQVSILSSARRILPKKFTTRTLKDENIMRVWRIR